MAPDSENELFEADFGLGRENPQGPEIPDGLYLPPAPSAVTPLPGIIGIQGPIREEEEGGRADPRGTSAGGQGLVVEGREDGEVLILYKIVSCLIGVSFLQFSVPNSALSASPLGYQYPLDPSAESRQRI